MRAIVLSLGLASVCAPLSAQVWTRQAPNPSAFQMRGVAMRSHTDVWAIGDDGVLVHTTDGGRVWQRRDLASDSMWKVRFATSTHGVAVGNGVFTTDDGGQSWRSRNFPHGTIYGVFHLDPQHLWLTEYGGVWRSTDGGASWLYSTRSGGNAHGIHFQDAQRGWIVSIDGTIEQTIDGGQTWSVVYKAPDMSNLVAVWFADDLEGWALGGQTVLHTFDGGVSWSPRSFPGTEWAFNATFAPSGSIGGGVVCYAVGAGGNVVRSDDGWSSWTISRAAANQPDLWDVDFLGADHGYAVGDYGVLLETRDGGASWHERQSGSVGHYHRICASDVAHAWVGTDYGQINYTTDGGNVWRRARPTSFSQFGVIRDVDFLADNLHGWATGNERTFASDAGHIVASRDGGRTWELQYVSPPDRFFHVIEALSEDVAIGAGWSRFGDVWVRTLDGGSSWQDITPPDPVGVVLCSSFVNENVGWIAGGRIWKTRDAGTSWTEQPLPDETIQGISFATRRDGWAVGGYGYVIHTSNGGRSWEQQGASLFSTYRMLDVSAVSETEAWVVGVESSPPFKRIVARTRDAGATWVSENVPAGNNETSFGAVGFVSADYGWIAGSWWTDLGGIWRRQDGNTEGATLLHDPLWTGERCEFRVTGSAPGGLALFMVSATGIGDGLCLPNGPCIDLLDPVLFFAHSPFGGDEVARLDVALPGDLPQVEVHLQALVFPPAGEIAKTNTTSAWIEP